MHRLKFADLLKVTGLTVERLKVLRQREQVALAFGKGNVYESDFLIPLDAVAYRLNEVLTEKRDGFGGMDRDLAAEIVRDQWGIWSRVVAEAERDNRKPAFFYIIAYDDQKGRRWWMTTGSTLDSRSDTNMRAMAEDIYKRFKVIPRNYTVIEMQSVLADVRQAARKAKLDFTAAFLPPAGDPRLDEILASHADDIPDRAIVTSEQGKEQWSEAARKAGIKARAAVEASLPPPERLQ